MSSPKGLNFGVSFSGGYFTPVTTFDFIVGETTENVGGNKYFYWLRRLITMNHK